MCARNFNARYCVTWSSTGRSTGLTRDAETTAALIKTSSINPLGEVTLWPSSKLERLYLGQGLHCSLFWKSKFKVNGVIYWYLPRNWWIFCWMSYKIINYTNFEQQKLDSFSFVKILTAKISWSILSYISMHLYFVQSYANDARLKNGRSS